MGWGKWIAGLLLGIALFGVSDARAQAGEVGAPLGTCVLPATPGTTARDVLSRLERFDCRTRQTNFGPGDFWVLAPRLPDIATSDGTIRIRSHSLWQRSMTVHGVYADGHIVGVASDGVGLLRHLRLGAIFEYQLPVRDAPLVQILWHVGGSANMRGILPRPHLATEDQSSQSELLLAMLYAAFCGLSIALIVYNLALWKTLRHAFQPMYCAMLLCLLIYAITSSGLLGWMLPDLPNNNRITINYVMLCWGTAAALGFSRRFFEERVFVGWIGRTTELAAIGYFVLGAALAAITPAGVRIADSVYSWCFTALPIVVLPILWGAWRRRSNYLWLFALTWAAPMTMVVARSAYNLNLVGWNFWLDNSTLLAMAAEAVMTSLAIAYRIRLLSIERDEAIRQQALTRRLADTDPLTGLLNRRAFLSQAIGDGGIRQLLILDLDHFKQVNDTIGHDGGDEVLRVAARTLVSTVPADALVARLGGEEFAVLSGPTALPHPDAILARLRAERMPFDIRVTASIGECHGPVSDDAEWKHLYRLADQALFHAKGAGRDRWRAAPTLAAA